MGFDRKDSDILVIAEADNVQLAVLRSWGGSLKWDRKYNCMRGIATLELLDKLEGLVKLTPTVKARQVSLRAVQDAVDRERSAQHPEPLVRYPVKLPLYQHQVRAANMALLTFGLVSPEVVRDGR